MLKKNNVIVSCGGIRFWNLTDDWFFSLLLPVCSVMMVVCCFEVMSYDCLLELALREFFEVKTSLKSVNH